MIMMKNTTIFKHIIRTMEIKLGKVISAVDMCIRWAPKLLTALFALYNSKLHRQISAQTRCAGILKKTMPNLLFHWLKNTTYCVSSAAAMHCHSTK